MEMKTLIVPHMPPPVPIKTTVPNSPSRSPLESPKKKGHLGASITPPLGTSPPTTPAWEHPTTLAITKNVVGKNSRSSSPLVSPSSPHFGRPHGKHPYKSPQPRSPVPRSPVAKSPVAKSPVAKSSAAKSPVKSPKKNAS